MRFIVFQYQGCKWMQVWRRGVDVKNNSYIYRYVTVSRKYCNTLLILIAHKIYKLHNHTIWVSNIRGDLTNSSSGATSTQSQTSDKDLLIKHPSPYPHMPWPFEDNQTISQPKTNKLTNRLESKQASKQASKQTNKAKQSKAKQSKAKQSKANKQTNKQANKQGWYLSWRIWKNKRLSYERWYDSKF